MIFSITGFIALLMTLRQNPCGFARSLRLSRMEMSMPELDPFGAHQDDALARDLPLDAR